MATTKPAGSHDGLLTALIAAQTAIGPAITKDATADTGKFRYRYATLATVVETVTPHLHSNGLVLYQALDATERGDVLLVTTLAHAETGEKIESRYPVRCQ